MSKIIALIMCFVCISSAVSSQTLFDRWALKAHEIKGSYIYYAQAPGKEFKTYSLKVEPENAENLILASKISLSNNWSPIDPSQSPPALVNNSNDAEVSLRLLPGNPILSIEKTYSNEKRGKSGEKISVYYLSLIFKCPVVIKLSTKAGEEIYTKTIDRSFRYTFGEGGNPDSRVGCCNADRPFFSEQSAKAEYSINQDAIKANIKESFLNSVAQNICHEVVSQFLVTKEIIPQVF